MDIISIIDLSSYSGYAPHSLSLSLSISYTFGICLSSSACFFAGQALFSHLWVGDKPLRIETGVVIKVGQGIAIDHTILI